MSTRSSARNLFPPLENLELTIRRRTRVDPNLLNDFNIATNGNGDDGPPPNGGGDLPVPDLRTMEELCQPTLNGRVQNSCQFHGLLGDDANKHLDKFLHVTQSIKVNGVSDDALHLDLFPHSLTHHATAWFDRFPRNSITTFEKMAKMLLGKYFPPSMVTKLKNEITNFRQHHDESLFEAWERYKLSIDRCTNHNVLAVTQIDTFYNGSESSSSFTSSSDPEIVVLKAEMAEINKNLMKNVYAARAYNQGGNSYQPQGNRNLLSYRSDNYLGPPGFNENQNRSNPNQNYQNRNQGNNHGNPQRNNQGRNQFFQGASHGQNPPPAYQALGYQAPANDAILKNMQMNMTSLTNSNLELKNMFGQFMKMNTASSSGSRMLPSNTVTNPKEDLKGITTRSGIGYKGPTIFTTSSPPKVVERETEVTKDTVPPTNNKSTKDVQPSVVQVETQILNSEPVVEPVEAPTGCALINVYEGELTLRVGKEAVTFKLDQTSRYSTNYDAESINRIDVACEEYSQEIIRFYETDPFLAIEDEPISPEINDSFYDSEGDILLLEEFLNDDISSPPLPSQELKVVEPKNEKSYIDEPPVVELKDLPPHLKYAFLESDDKLPVIIAKDLKDEEQTALIKVLKSHKQALAWQLFDIKGINPEFCTHKILMEDEFKPAVQHQRRVNPKFLEVIKKEVLKVLDAKLIYPISDSPWVSPVHGVPKKVVLPLLKMKKTS
nr:reverse transcriptase domain-containing protein [Tanacetum cinerariifolium]